MRDIRVIATDLDGTVIGGANEFPHYSEFREKLDDLDSRRQTVWVALTGRSMASFRRFFRPMGMVNLEPDFVVVHHAYIYSRTVLGYLPNLLWNVSVYMERAHKGIQRRRALKQWHALMSGSSLGVRTTRRTRTRLSLRFDSEESAGVAADLLREKTAGFEQLRVFRYRREVDVRTIPFTKGLALHSLCRHMDIESEKVLAIGNGHNDISMLDGRYARWTGCPANSDPEVMEVVHKSGGHIAKAPSLGGVLEIIEAYENDAVRNELPPGWEPPAMGDNPKPPRRSRHGGHRPPKVRLSIMLLVCYTLLAVLANFGFAPFRGLLLKPVRLIAKVASRVVPIEW